MYEIVSGPLVWASLGLFVLGVVIQSVRFFRLTKARPRSMVPGPPPSKPKKKKKKPDKKKERGEGGIPAMLMPLVIGFSSPWNRVVLWLRRSMFGSHPIMTVLTLLFHVLLFATPLFLLAHNTMIGWGLPSFPEAFSDFLTVVVILCCAAFLFRRIFMRRVRAISSAYDYFVLLVTAAPFVTGFLAYHQMFDYRTVLLIHMIAGELMLVLVPFTRLGHAVFFFLYRFFINGEYSFRQGRRAW